MANSSPSTLTKAQLDTLQAQLIQAREQIVGRAKTAAADGASEHDVGDAMDAATQANDAEAAVARTERDNLRLANIDHALSKFERGEYGVSEDSGEPIGFGRLKAIPWARLTVQEEEALAKRR